VISSAAKSRSLPGHAGQTAGQAPAFCPAAATAAPAGCDCPAGDAQLGHTAVNLSGRIGAETASGPIDPALAAGWTRRRRRPGAWQHEHRRNIIFTPGTFRRFTETLVKEIDPEMRSAYALSANVCERSTRSIRLRLSESAATASSAQITRSRAAWRTEMATRAAAQIGGSCTHLPRVYTYGPSQHCARAGRRGPCRVRMTRAAVGAACAVVPAEQLWKVLAAQRATHFPRGERAAVAAVAGLPAGRGRHPRGDPGRVSGGGLLIGGGRRRRCVPR